MILVLLLVLPLAREPETENTAYRYLIATSISKLRLGILTEQGEGS